jgi:hypothetical protein
MHLLPNLLGHRHPEGPEGTAFAMVDAEEQVAEADIPRAHTLTNALELWKPTGSLKVRGYFAFTKALGVGMLFIISVPV